MNFSSLHKNLRICFISFFLLSSCQNLRTRSDVHKNPAPRQAPQQTPAAPVTQLPATSVTEETAPVFNQSEQVAPPLQPIPEMPRIGVILSGGGAKTYAHIGFLQALGRLKIPLHSIAGIEFAAPMAALYANKELPNDVEWQMFKLKDDEISKRSLLGSSSKPADILVLSDFVHLTFGHLKVEDLKLPFACPAFNIAKNQVYLMSRGSVEALLPYCWPYPPLFKPYKSNVSAIREVKMVADYLRSKGANYILFINAMGVAQRKSYVGDVESTENVLWTEIASQYMKNQGGVDAVLSLNTEEFAINDFDKRREIMQKGAESADKALKNLSKKWGL